MQKNRLLMHSVTAPLSDSISQLPHHYPHTLSARLHFHNFRFRRDSIRRQTKWFPVYHKTRFHHFYPTLHRVLTRWRNTKHEALKELLNVYHLSPSEIVYIGDTVSDIMQCKIMNNVVCLSAAWSVENSTNEDLKRYNPGKAFNSIKKLSEYLFKPSNE